MALLRMALLLMVIMLAVGRRPVCIITSSGGVGAANMVMVGGTVWGREMAAVVGIGAGPDEAGRQAVPTGGILPVITTTGRTEWVRHGGICCSQTVVCNESTSRMIFAHT